jgi:hypothetical protein
LLAKSRVQLPGSLLNQELNKLLAKTFISAVNSLFFAMLAEIQASMKPKTTTQNQVRRLAPRQHPGGGPHGEIAVAGPATTMYGGAAVITALLVSAPGRPPPPRFCLP